MTIEVLIVLALFVSILALVVSLTRRSELKLSDEDKEALRLISLAHTTPTTALHIPSTNAAIIATSINALSQRMPSPNPSQRHAMRLSKLLNRRSQEG